MSLQGEVRGWRVNKVTIFQSPVIISDYGFHCNPNFCRICRGNPHVYLFTIELLNSNVFCSAIHTLSCYIRWLYCLTLIPNYVSTVTLMSQDFTVFNTFTPRMNNESCEVVLTFDHTNKSSMCCLFLAFYKMKSGHFVEF